MNLKTVLGVAAAVILTLASGAAHRVLTGAGLRRGVAVTQSDLETLPDRFGDWRKLEDTQVDEAALEVLRCDTHLARRYQHGPTGTIMEITLLVGPADTLAAHTPEVCYTTQTFDLVDNDQLFSIPAAAAGQGQSDLRFVELLGRDVNRTTLQVVYGWNDGSGWRAPKLARVLYAGTRNLLKLQMALQTVDPTINTNPLWDETLADLLPALERIAAADSP